ncbi:MAG: beta-galactosidase, partial [Rikenellaceae bacterium]
MKFKILFLALVATLFISCSTTNSTENVLSITLTQSQSYDFTTLEIEAPRAIPGMNGVSPSGDVLYANTQYLTYNGEPWLPSYGEFQYSRYPAEHWEDAIIKMKAAGFTGLSCYVFWIHHEEREGEWDWTGRRDFRHFLELCRKHDFKVFARIGPWVNGECRNGGHPDWLMYKLGNKENALGLNGRGGVLRTTDPKYLYYVDKLYEQLAIQMDGMYWKDGGPIFAVQLDNENRRHGPGTGADLLTAEKELALKHNIIVPYYTSTGWGGADFNQDETLPMYGTYIDFFWNPANYIPRARGYSFTTVRAEAETDTV